MKPRLNHSILISIKQKTFQIYKQITSKEQQSALTVLCSFSLVKDQEVQVVTLGTGTKSLQQKDIFTQPIIHCVHQCHGEVIARRAFKNYIVSQLENYFSKQDSIFIKNKNNKIQINPLIKLAMYTSQPPCGQCSIAPKSEIYGLSGAKPLNLVLDDINDFSILRHPPGSTRIQNPENISPSLCCSDKIMLWNILGVQGSALSSLINPIYIDYLIVDTRDQLIQDSLKLGQNIQCRLKKYNLKKDIFYIKNKRISKSFKINTPRLYFGLKNHFQYSKYHPENDNQNKRFGVNEMDQNYQAYSYIYLIGGKIEKINSLNGLKWGITKKDIEKPVAISQISKYQFYQKLKELLLRFKDSEEINGLLNILQQIHMIKLEEIQYSQLKQSAFKYYLIKCQIKFQFKQWTKSKIITEQFI